MILYAFLFPSSFILARKSAPKDIWDNGTDADILATGHKEKLGYTIEIVPWVQEENIKIHKVSEDESVFSDKEETDSLFKEHFWK